MNGRSADTSHGTGRILIVGAGIAGLTLAQALRQQGLPCEVSERAAAFGAAGAGIVLASNATRVLGALGLSGELRAIGQPVTGAVITDARGRTLTVPGTERLIARLGVPLALYRPELHAALLQPVRDLVTTGRALGSLSQDQAGVSVRFADGSSGRYDLVIGADGLNSAVRRELFGRPARYAGYTSWRFVTRNSVGLQRSLELWGHGRRFGLVPLSRGRLYGFSTLNAPAGRDPTGGDLHAYRAAYRHFAQPVSGVLAQLTPQDTLIRTDIREVPPGPWVKGRVALIGDAAHGMTPNLGQGAGMGIEDAWVLARFLRESSGPEALRGFEAHRRARVKRVQDESRLGGLIGQLEHPLLLRARDGLLRRAPTKALARHLEALLTGEALLPPAGDTTAFPPA